MVNYQIRLNQSSHVYHVTLQFTANKTEHVLKLATWIPGSYMLREFSKNIINISATQDGRSLDCIQTEKNIWWINNLSLGNKVSVSYTVYAYEFGIRTAFLDLTRGYFNNTSLCLYIVGEQHVLHTITLEDLPPKWQIATGLASTTTKNQYFANDYDELIDSPVELGEFRRLEFDVNGTKHYFVLSGTLSTNFDAKRLIEDVSKICKAQIDLFGGVAPFKDYTFILYLGGEVFTGLEHRNSTLLMAPYYSLPMLHQAEISADYLKLLGLISHEFFHSWNVKRIKPQVFNPYNLDTENYTKLLWWFEGITSYYDDLILRRAGIIDDKCYLGLITENINNVYKYNGTCEQTLTNGSLTSWIKYYRQDENSPNALVSYYVKGSLVGMCIDLLIRIKTISAKSLDDVMLGLFNKWQNDGLGVGEGQIPQLIQEYTGLNLSSEIEYFIDSCLELPYPQLLGRFGIGTHSIETACHGDSGKVVQDIKELPKQQKFDLGCKLAKDAFAYKVVNVYAKSLAQDIGLGAGDILIALNDVKLTDIDKQLSLFVTGDKLKLTLFRQEKLLNLSFEYRLSAFNLTYLQINDVQLLSNWLG